MVYRFYDIVAESGESEYFLNKEFTLSIPERDLSIPVERQEHLADMLEALVAASGCEISSFSCDLVNQT